MNESQRFDDKKEHFTLQMWEREKPLWCVDKKEEKWWLLYYDMDVEVVKYQISSFLGELVIISLVNLQKIS